MFLPRTIGGREKKVFYRMKSTATTKKPCEYTGQTESNKNVQKKLLQQQIPLTSNKELNGNASGSCERDKKRANERRSEKGKNCAEQFE